MRLAFIGGGVMGEAILAAVLARKLADADEIAVCEVLAKRRSHLEANYGVRTTETGVGAAEGAELVLLVVKPQDFLAAAGPIKGQLGPNQTVLSIMAGTRIETIREALGHEAIVRAIPNTSAQVGEGISVWTSTAAASDEGKEAARRTLASLGHEIFVDDERYIDIATAVSGSGPAYIFLVMEAFIDAAVHIGLRREMAEAMVIQTVLGSARYAQASGRHPAELRNEVTSPGGTTTHGLMALERAGIRAAFLSAVDGAYTKARELGG